MAYISASTADQKVQAGYLARCSPQAAYDWLEARAPKTEVESRDARNIFAALPDLEEYVLLRRNDGLIDLGLARFGYTERAVRRAYRRGGAACRIAAWSNVAARGSSLMTEVWADERDLARLAEHGARHELITMAANPALGDSVLTDLVGRKGSFLALTDLRWATCVVGLSKNTRMQQAYGRDRPMDGYAEYSHGKVFTEAWKLASTLPVEQQWAALLERLLRDCRMPHGQAGDAEAMLARWRIDKMKKPEDKHYYPGPSFHLRTRLADLLKADAALLASEDRAMRLSFWKRFDPYQHNSWVEDMGRVFETETESEAQDALSAALRNDRLWRTEELREHLKSLCWRAPDLRHDMMMPNSHAASLRHVQQEHPEWFRVPATDVQPSGALTSDALRDTTMAELRAWLSKGAGSKAEGFQPAWAMKLSDRVVLVDDRVASLTGELRDRLPGQAPPPRPWWTIVPWWVWLAVGAAAYRALSMMH